ncbi:MAG: ATP-dependent Clp protease proteolytic subunit [Patescibacteria group bacterium]
MIYPKGFDELRPFLARREIILVGDVATDPEIQEQIISAAILYLNAVSSESITLFVDSCGGSGDTAQNISDNIKNSAAPVYGVVTGVAYSAAFAVIQACHRRMAYPNAKLMFHGGSLTIRVDNIIDAKIVSEDTVRLGRKQIDELRKRISYHQKEISGIAERSGQPLKLIKKWWKEERIFTAPEAKEFGFIDEIVKKPT